MILFNQTILQIQKKQFHLRLQYLLLCFYNILNLFTVNWKSAILNLQYKNLLLFIQRDLHREPSVSIIDFRSEFIKQNLRMRKLYMILHHSVQVYYSWFISSMLTVDTATHLYCWRLFSMSHLSSAHTSFFSAFYSTSRCSRTLAFS